MSKLHCADCHTETIGSAKAMGWFVWSLHVSGHRGWDEYHRCPRCMRKRKRVKWNPVGITLGPIECEPPTIFDGMSTGGENL